jgi:hypothetical protein
MHAETSFHLYYVPASVTEHGDLYWIRELQPVKHLTSTLFIATLHLIYPKAIIPTSNCATSISKLHYAVNVWFLEFMVGGEQVGTKESDTLGHMSENDRTVVSISILKYHVPTANRRGVTLSTTAVPEELAGTYNRDGMHI